MLAAIRGKFFAKGKQKKNTAMDSAAAGARPKIISMQLCWRHAKYGSKAFRCADKSACQWLEN
jgi:hypothetical protein